MVDRATLQQSLDAVREAHGVLRAFHAEVCAFFRVLEEAVTSEPLGGVLTPFENGDVTISFTGSMKKLDLWVPTWMGRFFYDETLQTPDEEPETIGSRAAAFVAVTVEPGEPPDCWLVLGRPGEGSRAKNAWDFGRNGLWNFGLDSPDYGAWSGGSLPDSSMYGAGGLWRASRVPLVELANPADVERLVAAPLVREWRRVIRQEKGIE